MSLYTKTGDKGLASTITRRQIPKDSPTFQLLGALDEATSHLGLAKTYLPNDMKLIVENIQKDINGVSGEIAGAGVYIKPDMIAQLESAIDSIMQSIPEVKLFIIPGATRAGAELDIARTVVRRAEREAISVIQAGGPSRNVLAWINRLSDMVYALARMADALLADGQNTSSASSVSTQKSIPIGESIQVQSDNYFEQASAVCRKVIEQARLQGLAAVVAICDHGGNLVCFNRDDDAYIASIDVAINKAFTSMSLKMTTKQVGELAATGQTLHGVQYTNQGRIVIFGGGVPLYHNGKLVGAIGVSGGTSEQDDALAEYGSAVFSGIQ